MGPMQTNDGPETFSPPHTTSDWRCMHGVPKAEGLLVSGGSPRPAVRLRLGDATSRHAGSLLSTRPVLNGEASIRVEQQPHAHMRTAIRRLSAALRGV